MIGKVKALIPALAMALHKGQSGRVGVVGGSLEYTGAPYYAAISSLRCGADLAFVFCGEEQAALPIKAYSPELIVYPTLNASFEVVSPRLSSVVFGPGLGRNADTLKECARAILIAREKQLPIVLDGDALWLLQTSPELVRGYAQAIITPNQAEFARLLAVAKIVPGPSVAGGEADISLEPALSVAKLAKWLGGATVLRKGQVDLISNGHELASVSEFGSARRCGGQGDVLAGALGVFNGWAKGQDTITAAFGAALLTRKANALAFNVHGRSMTTPDLVQHLGQAFRDLYETDSCSL